MKTKTIFFLLLLTALAACTEKTLVVQFPSRLKEAVSFKKFDKIFLSGLNIQSTIKSPDPKIELIDFFTGEYPKVINRKIEYVEFEENALDRSQALKEKLMNFPNSLLITGTFKTDIKTRSIVRDIKSDSQKKKAFVQIELWEMLLELEYIETDSFKTLEKRTFRANIRDADPKKTEFNFKSLFDKITDQFLLESQKKFKIQERYLLKKIG